MKHFTALMTHDGEIFHIQTRLFEPENLYKIQLTDNGYYQISINAVNWTEAISDFVTIAFRIKKIFTTDFKE